MGDNDVTDDSSRLTRNERRMYFWAGVCLSAAGIAILTTIVQAITS